MPSNKEAKRVRRLNRQRRYRPIAPPQKVQPFGFTESQRMSIDELKNFLYRRETVGERVKRFFRKLFLLPWR